MAGSNFFLSVQDFGALGDGHTDDTEAIQTAINFLYERGGGTLFFPFTTKGYRIAKPALEQINGQPCRSQLYIPSEPRDPLKWRNICLVGEMPVKQLYAYQMFTGSHWPTTEFPMNINNVCLISDWEAPEEPDKNERPWSLISVLGGHTLPFGVENLTVRNLEFRVFLNTNKMYPTSSAANFKSAARLILENSYFGLSQNVCSASENKELLANPCYTAGVIASDDQNDHQVFRSVGAQGFRYGFVLGEHVCADYLYVHNCDEAVVFHDSSHLSVINHIVAQHNRIIISALREPTFGLRPSFNVYVKIHALDYEAGTNRPLAYRLQFGVYDPDHRITGEITHHSGFPVAADSFHIAGGNRVKATKFGTW